MESKIYELGISTTVDFTVELPILLRFFSQNRFQFISIAASTLHNYYPDLNRFGDVIRMAENYNLRIDSMHVPFGQEYDLASPEFDNRERAIENVLKFLDYINANKINTAIIHPHYYLAETKESALEKAADSIRRIIESGPVNIDIAIENLPRSDGSWICGRLLDLFNKDKIGFCYDSSHENMSGPPFHLLEKYFSRLTTCHLSDNNGESDEHLIPGEGNMDWAKMRSFIDMAEGFRRILLEVGTGEPLAEPVGDFIRKAAVNAAKIFGPLGYQVSNNQ